MYMRDNRNFLQQEKGATEVPRGHRSMKVTYINLLLKYAE